MLSNKKKVFLITSSLKFGGAERVISELAAYFSGKDDLAVTIVCLVKEKQVYGVPKEVTIIEPDFDYKQYSRPIFTFKIYRYLRKILKMERPDTLLSFGGKYNSFVLLAALGLKIPSFISDRSRPTISYGKIKDMINARLYKTARGIVAQTTLAKEVSLKKNKNPNVRVISNPIRMVVKADVPKENIILNVGRFIKSKHQILLAEYFAAVHDGNWKLIFLGDGRYLEEVRVRVKELGIEEWVDFPGMKQDVDSYYRRAKIFAFTSTSEGFPNVLGEALSVPLACMSFNCVAGPADLIEDGVNGFLVEELNHEAYKNKLQRLMQDASLRKDFENEAEKRIRNFTMEQIGEQYLNFILP
ncbi:MAG: glycosyltransferase [Ferruginibacter sp.]